MKGNKLTTTKIRSKRFKRALMMRAKKRCEITRIDYSASLSWPSLLPSFPFIMGDQEVTGYGNGSASAGYFLLPFVSRWFDAGMLSSTPLHSNVSVFACVCNAWEVCSPGQRALHSDATHVRGHIHSPAQMHGCVLRGGRGQRTQIRRHRRRYMHS